MSEISTRNSYGAPSEHEMVVFQTMAKSAVDSKMYRGIGDQSGVMMIMLAAREIGIPPMQALNGGLNIIQGKVEISARMMNALIRKSGHHVVVKESTNTICTLEGKRSDTGETQISSFSIEDAQRAGLVKGTAGGWSKFPQDMCYARALSRLARQLFPDVIGIGYVEGEIKAVESTRSCCTEPQQVQIDQQVEQQVEIPEADDLNELLSKFPEKEDALVLEYVNVIMKHFGWSYRECVKKLLQEKDVLDKFQTWKKKKCG